MWVLLWSLQMVVARKFTQSHPRYRIPSVRIQESVNRDQPKTFPFAAKRCTGLFPSHTKPFLPHRERDNRFLEWLQHITLLCTLEWKCLHIFATDVCSPQEWHGRKGALILHTSALFWPPWRPDNDFSDCFRDISDWTANYLCYWLCHWLSDDFWRWLSLTYGCIIPSERSSENFLNTPYSDKF